MITNYLIILLNKSIILYYIIIISNHDRNKIPMIIITSFFDSISLYCLVFSAFYLQDDYIIIEIYLTLYKI